MYVGTYEYLYVCITECHSCAQHIWLLYYWKSQSNMRTVMGLCVMYILAYDICLSYRVRCCGLADHNRPVHYWRKLHHCTLLLHTKFSTRGA